MPKYSKFDQNVLQAIVTIFLKTAILEDNNIKEYPKDLNSTPYVYIKKPILRQLVTLGLINRHFNIAVADVFEQKIISEAQFLGSALMEKNVRPELNDEHQYHISLLYMESQYLRLTGRRFPKAHTKYNMTSRHFYRAFRNPMEELKNFGTQTGIFISCEVFPWGEKLLQDDYFLNRIFNHIKTLTIDISNGIVGNQAAQSLIDATQLPNLSIEICNVFVKVNLQQPYEPFRFLRPIAEKIKHVILMPDPMYIKREYTTSVEADILNHFKKIESISLVPVHGELIYRKNSEKFFELFERLVLKVDPKRIKIEGVVDWGFSLPFRNSLAGFSLDCFALIALSDFIEPQHCFNMHDVEFIVLDRDLIIQNGQILEQAEWFIKGIKNLTLKFEKSLDKEFRYPTGIVPKIFDTNHDITTLLLNLGETQLSASDFIDYFETVEDLSVSYVPTASYTTPQDMIIKIIEKSPRLRSLSVKLSLATLSLKNLISKLIKLANKTQLMVVKIFAEFEMKEHKEIFRIFLDDDLDEAFIPLNKKFTDFFFLRQAKREDGSFVDVIVFDTGKFVQHLTGVSCRVTRKNIQFRRL